jgi:hypothetical protein
MTEFAGDHMVRGLLTFARAAPERETQAGSLTETASSFFKVRVAAGSLPTQYKAGTQDKISSGLVTRKVTDAQRSVWMRFVHFLLS